MNAYLQEHWIQVVAPWKTTPPSLLCAYAVRLMELCRLQSCWVLAEPLGLQTCLTFLDLLCPLGPGLQTAFSRLCLGSACGGTSGTWVVINWKESEYFSASTLPPASSPSSAGSLSRLSIPFLLSLSLCVSLSLSLLFSLIPFSHVYLT